LTSKKCCGITTEYLNAFYELTRLVKSFQLVVAGPMGFLVAEGKIFCGGTR
jgi:hypothetical protein